MKAKSWRAIGLILIGVSTIFLYMEALNDIRTWNLLGDSMLRSEPLDMWARFPEGEYGWRDVEECPHAKPTNRIVASLTPYYAPGLDDDTSSVFSLLSDNQNPEDCSERKYFLWAPLNWGIGSDIHTIGA